MRHRMNSESWILWMQDMSQNLTRDKELDMRKKTLIMEKELEHEIYNKASSSYLNLNKEWVQADAILLQHELREARKIVEVLSHKTMDEK